MVSLSCKILCRLSICTLESDQWITKWWAKFESECLLLILIYSNSKFNVTCKNVDFQCRFIRNRTEENLYKISNITFAILHYIRYFAFLSKNKTKQNKTKTKTKKNKIKKKQSRTKQSKTKQNKKDKQTNKTKQNKNKNTHTQTKCWIGLQNLLTI